MSGRALDLARILCLVGAMACLGACAGARRASPVAAAPTGEEPDFAAAAGILDGFEIDPEPGPWRVGDRVLLGLRFWRAGEATTLYMLSELTGVPEFDRPFEVTARPQNHPRVTVTSPTCRTRIRVYDDAGVLIQESQGRLPTTILNCGLYDGAMGELAIQSAVAGGGRREDQPFNERALRGFFAFIVFGQSTGRNKVIADLVARLIDRPPLVSLLLRRELTLGWIDGAGPAPGESVRLGGLERPTCSFPIAASINGRPAASAVLKVIPSTAPVGLCGGMIEADVRHPRHAESRAHVRLLAARRGDGPEVAPLERMPSIVIDGQVFGPARDGPRPER